MAEASVLFLGFPEAGKSTYLAAFFIACEADSDELSLVRCAGGNREYLRKLQTKLAKNEELTRTGQRDPGLLDLHISFGGDGTERLLIPDLSGEHLRESMNSRYLAEELGELLDPVTTVLLFFRADRLQPVVPLEEFVEHLKAAGESPGDAVMDEEDPAAAADWRIEISPTQPRLLDVVLETLRLKSGEVRVGLVASAWDAREDQSGTPLEWAEENVPTVIDALSAADVDWELFAVSAQGGDFDNDEDRKRLEKTRLHERAQLLRADGTKDSIGAPLKWALSS